jgi:hypothetical protein
MSAPPTAKAAGQAGGVTPSPSAYPGCSFSAEVIRYAIWLCKVFGVSPATSS